MPFSLKDFIAENRELLKPPVGNKLIYQDPQFIVMLVGGPNSRQDYHVDPGPEFFYQIEGDIVLKTQAEGILKPILIRAGEIFLLPAWIPHSPQRPAGSVGLVIERVRKKDEQDAFEWYCDECNHRLHRVDVHVFDIVKQLPPIFADYAKNFTDKPCQQCRFINPI